MPKMMEGKGLPPPRDKKKMGGGQMTEEDPSTYGRLSKLAGGDNQPDPTEDEMGSGMVGGMMSPEQAPQMFMEGVQMMAQAAEADPRLQPIIQAVLPTLQQGIQSLTGGGGGTGEKGEKGGGRGRRQPPNMEGAPPEY